MGDTLEILIKENPTTGFKWEIYEKGVTASGLGGVLKLVNSTYVQDPSNRPALGRGGTRTMDFLVAQTGSGNLVLVYRRSWETLEEDD